MSVMDAELRDTENVVGATERPASASNGDPGRSDPAPNGGPSAGAGAAESGAVENGELRERVMDALRQVDDPELGINIVDLGLVYEVSLEGDTVHIEYTLTTMGCPIGPLIEQQIQRMIDPIEGIEHVDAEMVLTPPWTPDKMSEEAKAALGMF